MTKQNDGLDHLRTPEALKKWLARDEQASTLAAWARNIGLRVLSGGFLVVDPEDLTAFCGEPGVGWVDDPIRATVFTERDARLAAGPESRVMRPLEWLAEVEAQKSRERVLTGPESVDRLHRQQHCDAAGTDARESTGEDWHTSMGKDFREIERRSAEFERDLRKIAASLPDTQEAATLATKTDLRTRAEHLAHEFAEEWSAGWAPSVATVDAWLGERRPVTIADPGLVVEVGAALGLREEPQSERKFTGPDWAFSHPASEITEEELRRFWRLPEGADRRDIRSAMAHAYVVTERHAGVSKGAPTRFNASDVAPSEVDG